MRWVQQRAATKADHSMGKCLGQQGVQAAAVGLDRGASRSFTRPLIWALPSQHAHALKSTSQGQQQGQVEVENGTKIGFLDHPSRGV